MKNKSTTSASTTEPVVLTTEAERQAERHLIKVDPIMARLVTTHGPCTISMKEFVPFQTLVTSIISQQLSTKAADTIQQRVLARASAFTPTGLLALSTETLRSAGLSGAKARYILELSSRVVDGRLDFNALTNLSDELVINTLTEIPGIGKWTAEMFLIFGLKRANVLTTGDAALRRAVRALYGNDQTLERVGQAWHPYCSVASWYLWRQLA